MLGADPSMTMLSCCEIAGAVRIFLLFFLEFCELKVSLAFNFSGELKPVARLAERALL